MSRPSALHAPDEIVARRVVDRAGGCVRFVVSAGNDVIGEWRVHPAYETPEDAELAVEHIRRRHEAIRSRRAIALMAS